MDEMGPYRRHVRRKYSTLRRDLRPDEIVAILYQEEHLTDEERVEITSRRTVHEKNQKLLDYLNSEDACECFFNALPKTAQKHLQEGFPEDSSAGYGSRSGGTSPSVPVSSLPSILNSSAILAMLNDDSPEPFEFDKIDTIDTITREEHRIWKECGFSDELMIEMGNARKRMIDNEVARFALPENKPPRGFVRPERLNVVFVGRTGNGKSTSANTLIGEEVFETCGGDAAVTEVVRAHQFNYEGCEVRVVDTPGLADADILPDELALLLAKVIEVCPEGVHAFLYMHNATDYRYTAEQQSVKEMILEIFGLDILEHMAVVLTHAGDGLRGINLSEYLAQNTKGMRTFLEKEIHNRVLAIENKAEPRYHKACMRRLLFELIDFMLSRVGNKIYTSEHFESARTLQKLTDTSCILALANLEKRNRLKFEQAYRIARSDALEVASEFLKNELVSLEQVRSQDIGTVILNLRPKLVRYLEGKADTYRQLDRLSTESDCPLQDILKESLHLGTLQRCQDLAQELGSRSDELRYKALMKVHEFDDYHGFSKEKLCVKLYDDDLIVSDTEIMAEVRIAKLFRERETFYEKQITVHHHSVEADIRAKVTDFILSAKFEQLPEIHSDRYIDDIYQRVTQNISENAFHYWGENELRERIKNVANRKCDRIKSSARHVRYKAVKRLEFCSIL